MINSDEHWIRLGRLDPYLKTVQTLDPYKVDRGASYDVDSYFASGERYVSDLFEAIDRHVSPAFKPQTAVDFGCSVGRVAIPLARRCESVTGIDVSPDALAEAERNAARLGVSNIRWLASDDQLTAVSDRPDLFHSYNVLQHLPVVRGLRIIHRALALLVPGGIIAIHVPYADRAPALRRAVNWAQAFIPGIHALANVVRGRSLDYPHMYMNPYDLPTIISMMRERGCDGVYLKLVDQGRYPGAILIARTPTS